MNVKVGRKCEGSVACIQIQQATTLDKKIQSDDSPTPKNVISYQPARRELPARGLTPAYACYTRLCRLAPYRHSNDSGSTPQPRKSSI